MTLGPLEPNLQAFAWTDGELLIWISSNRPFHALSDLGKAFEKEVGAPVKVETQEQIIERFQSAAQSGKGPDICFWANDRIGEWGDSGLLKPRGSPRGCLRRNAKRPSGE